MAWNLRVKVVEDCVRGRLAREQGRTVQPDFAWLWTDMNFGPQVGLKRENLTFPADGYGSGATPR